MDNFVLDRPILVGDIKKMFNLNRLTFDYIRFSIHVLDIEN